MMNMNGALPVGETLGRAWDKVRGAKKPFWAAIGLTLLIGFGIGFLSGLLSHVSDMLSLLCNLAGQLVNTLLQMGLLYMGIQRAKDLPINFRQVFRAFDLPIAARVIGVYLIQFLIFLPITFVFIVLPMIFLGGDIAMILSSGASLASFLLVSWYLIGVLACIYLTLRMFISMGFVLETGMNSWQAVKQSFAATRHHELSLLAIVLFQILAIIIGALPVLLGLIWTLPFALIIFGMVYKNLTINPSR